MFEGPIDISETLKPSGPIQSDCAGLPTGFCHPLNGHDLFNEVAVLQMVGHFKAGEHTKGVSLGCTQLSL